MHASQLNRLLLSAILICLIVLIYQNQLSLQTTRSASVAPQDAHVRVVSHVPGHSPSEYAVVPLNPDGSIDVRVKRVDGVIDVNIEEIDTYDKLNVHIKSTDNYALQSAGPLEVEER